MFFISDAQNKKMTYNCPNIIIKKKIIILLHFFLTKLLTYFFKYLWCKQQNHKTSTDPRDFVSRSVSQVF